MASSVVIKVKYEDTLRRFNVLVNGDQRLDISMEGLRLKICSLFNLPSSTCFTLTYRDEDDDLVTLGDDEDLQDVVRQGLNPVRITVCLKTEKPTGASSIGNSKPRESPSPNSQQNVNLNVAEALKSVPEPLRNAFSKISTDLTSKAASTSPVLADLLDGLSKLGHSYLNVAPPCSAANANIFAEGCDDPNKNAPCGKVDASVDKGVKLNEGQTSGSVQQSPKTTQTATTREANFNQPLFYHPKGKDAIPEPSSRLPTTEIMDSRLAELGKKYKEDYEKCLRKSGFCSKGSLKKRVSSGKDTYKPSLVGDNRRFSFGGPNSTSYFDSNPLGKYPFSGDVIPTAHTLPHEPNNFFDPFPPAHTLDESFNKVDGMGSIFHKGVRCDGCGVLPITGPRFKSKVKHDYDLCSICFGRMGNDLDYTRIDFPLPYRHPWAFKDLYDPCKGFRIPPVQLPNMRRPGGKHIRSRFDCRFIMDVNVMDGTMMAPLTPFTKIWRMRNNGALPWHRGLQLVWIGGDRFSASDSVEIEIPVDGVNVGKEIDIAVDFVAPELPGRYISYWRMAEPSGQKFGQRVWVLIQVDASVDLTLDASSGLNLNFPPETTGALGPQQLDVLEPELDVEAPLLGSSMAEQRRKIEIEDLNFPINNDLLVAGDVLSSTPAATSSTVPAVGADNGALREVSASASSSGVSYPDLFGNDNHESPPSAPPSTLYPIIDMNDGSIASSSIDMNDKSLEQDRGKDHVEETLLKELENMGFKQVDLNKEVLRVNEYDLERSVDELCGVSEWDPILEELKEMGFEDKETNKKLLAKNNGSITRVVMDLIAGE